MNTYLYNGEVVTASNKKSILKNKRVVATDKYHLEELIDEAIEKYGYECDLNFIDVSHVKSMDYLFYMSNFNGDISNWDVSKVNNMNGMFEYSSFNKDISRWDVSNVGTMYRMVDGSKFNGDISNWNVSKVWDMSSMFNNSKFNGDLSKWLPMMKKNGIDFNNLGLDINDDTWNDIEV